MQAPSIQSDPFSSYGPLFRGIPFNFLFTILEHSARDARPTGNNWLYLNLKQEN